MENPTALTPSQQRYLTAILSLELEQKCARQSEIAAMVRVNRSSATAALRGLAERALIFYEPYEAVTLTPEGRETAEVLVSRSRTIEDFLVRVLGIEEDAAKEAAFHMQHSVPGIVLDQFSARLKVCERKKSPS